MVAGRGRGRFIRGRSTNVSLPLCPQLGEYVDRFGSETVSSRSWNDTWTTTLSQDLVPRPWLYFGEIPDDVSEGVETLPLLFTIFSLQNNFVLPR